MTKHKKLFLIPVFLLAICIMSVAVYAIDLNRTGSISVTIRSGEGNHYPVGNVSLMLYKVADINENGYNLGYVYTPEFAGCGMSLDDLSSEGLASHLAAYAAQYNIAGRLASGNPVIFDDLTLGLYLIVQVGAADGYYPILPFIVSIPMTNADGTGWDYDVSADPKVQARPTNVVETPDKTRVSVKKVWVGTDSDRPEYVEIALLRDGLIYDLVALSADNDWKYTWSELDSNYNWSVAELIVPDGYEVRYSVAGATYTITNTKENENPPDPNEDPPDEYPDEEPKLAQTGQLNWPILVLASVGVVLFMIGWGVTFLGSKSDK